jgi:Putative peptidoglycan binding domain
MFCFKSISSLNFIRPLFWVALFLIFGPALAAQDAPLVFESGKCYEKSTVWKFGTMQTSVPLYTGPDTTKNVEKTTFTKPTLTDTSLWVVFDTLITRDYKWVTFETIDYSNIVSEYSGWYEVLCDNKKNSPVIAKIIRALKERGYETNSATHMDASAKSALIKFQKKYGLPIGHLDTKTLKALGINMEP